MIKTISANHELARRMSAHQIEDFLSVVRKKIKFYPLSWTFSDDFTLISKGEYEWRQKRGLPCDVNGKCYMRPMRMLDLLCFEVSLAILDETDSPSLLYTA